MPRIKGAAGGSRDNSQEKPLVLDPMPFDSPAPWRNALSALRPAAGTSWLVRGLIVAAIAVAAIYLFRDTLLGPAVETHAVRRGDLV